MPELTMTHLRVVVEIDRRGSVTAAAHALGFTQSAISRQLQGAEVAAGISLFERHARGVRVTEAGGVLLEHARQIIYETDAAEIELARLRGGVRGRVSIGAYPAAHAFMIPEAVALLVRRHPGITPEISEGSTPALIERVRSGSVHAALIAVGEGLPAYDLDGASIVELPSHVGSGVAVGHDHPLASRAELFVADLAGQRWIAGAGARGEPQFDAWPGAADAVIAFSARTWHARMGLVAAGLGIAVVPATTAPALPRRVTWVPVRDRAYDGRRTVVITGPAPTAGARAFVTAVGDVLRDFVSS